MVLKHVTNASWKVSSTIIVVEKTASGKTEKRKTMAILQSQWLRQWRIATLTRRLDKKTEVEARM